MAKSGSRAGIGMFFGAHLFGLHQENAHADCGERDRAYERVVFITFMV